MSPLDPAWPRAERWSWYVFDAALLIPSLVGLAVGGVFGFGSWLHGALVAGWVLLAVGLGWGTLCYPRAAHRRAAIGVSPVGVEFHRGVWWRKVTVIPRSRVQHTDVVQGPIMRRLGLGKLVVHTAGTRNAVVEIPGLAFDRAERVRDELLAGQDRAAAPGAVGSAEDKPEPGPGPQAETTGPAAGGSGSEANPEVGGG